MKPALGWMLGITALVGACRAATPADDKTAREHDKIAMQQEDLASAEDAKYDATMKEIHERCRFSKQTGSDICWFSVTNPTAKHREDAERHRHAAKEHRAASAALRTAEETACAGLSEMDRDMSPLRHAEDVRAVSELPDGARLELGPVAGLDEAKLQRVLDCHLARNAAVGWEMPEMSYCPLAVRGATAKASHTSDGFAVEVRGSDPATVAEIRTRAAGATPH